MRTRPGTLARWFVHRGYQLFAKQATSGQPLHVYVSKLPTENRFQHGIGQQRSGCSGLAPIQTPQVLAQRRGAQTQLREDGAA